MSLLRETKFSMGTAQSTVLSFLFPCLMTEEEMREALGSVADTEEGKRLLNWANNMRNDVKDAHTKKRIRNLFQDAIQSNWLLTNTHSGFALGSLPAVSVAEDPEFGVWAQRVHKIIEETPAPPGTPRLWSVLQALEEGMPIRYAWGLFQGNPAAHECWSQLMNMKPAKKE